MISTIGALKFESQRVMLVAHRDDDQIVSSHLRRRMSSRKLLGIELTIALRFLGPNEGFNLLAAELISHEELVVHFGVTPLDYMAHNVFIPRGLLHKAPSVFEVDDRHAAFIQAVTNNKLQWVRLFLSEVVDGSSAIDPTRDENFALLESLRWGSEEVSMLLLEHPAVDPSVPDNRPVHYAAKRGHLKVLRKVLDNEKVDPSAADNLALVNATLTNQIDAVQMLLDDPRVGPTNGHEGWSRAILDAARAARVEILRMLLRDPRTDATSISNHVLFDAIISNDEDTLRLLLEDGRFDPSVDDNEAIIDACSNGKTNLVKLLLSDPRVDPSARDGEALIASCRYMSSDPSIVEALLQHPKTCPSARDYEALRRATKYKNHTILDLLLKHRDTDLQRVEESVFRAWVNSNPQLQAVLRTPSIFAAHPEYYNSRELYQAWQRKDVPCLTGLSSAHDLAPSESKVC